MKRKLIITAILCLTLFTSSYAATKLGEKIKRFHECVLTLDSAALNDATTSKIDSLFEVLAESLPFKDRQKPAEVNLLNMDSIFLAHLEAQIDQRDSIGILSDSIIKLNNKETPKGDTHEVRATTTTDKESSQDNLFSGLSKILLIVVGVLLAVIVWLVIRSRKSKKLQQEPLIINETKETPKPTPIVEETKIEEQPSQSEPEVLPVTNEQQWVIVGASVKGNGHIQSNMPCQDNHKFESLGDGWGIAIVSDGAGSAAHSEVGSKLVAERGIIRFKALIETEGWKAKNELPSDIKWLQKSYATLKDLRNDVLMVAEKNQVEPKSLSATCLVVIYSPLGLLAVHVGDGRMGYKTMSGEWKSMMTPHKGEEANQTIFLISEFWDIPNYELSGVLVPESIVIREPVQAFALMSDGCEHTAWKCTTQDPTTGKYYDRNLPFEGFFNPLEETLKTFHQQNTPEQERQDKWYKFIESGTSGFVKEQDDKTLIYAVNIIEKQV